jgi:hypothetical protein
MVLRARRLLLVGALAYAVVASAGRADTSSAYPESGAAGRSGGVALLTLRAGTDLAVVPVSPGAALTLVALRTSETALERSGLAPPPGAALASLAFALALVVRVDLAPTGRLGLARRRGPPVLLDTRS